MKGGRFFRGICMLSMVPVLIVCLTSPAWALGIGFWFLSINKPEGSALIGSVVGFALAWPYGIAVRPILGWMQLFPR